MNDKAEKKLIRIVQQEFPSHNNIGQFKQWFLQQFQNCSRHCNCNDNDDDNDNCTLEEFAIHFLNELKQYTATHLKENIFDNEIIKRSETIQLDETRQGDELEIDMPEMTKKSLILTSTPCKSDQIISVAAGEASMSSCKSFNISTPLNDQHDSRRDQRHQQQQEQQQQQCQQQQQLQRRHSCTSSLSSYRNSTSPICLGDYLVAGGSGNVLSRHQKKRMPQLHNKVKNVNSNLNVEESIKSNNKSVEKTKKRVAPTTITTKSTVSRKLNVTQNVSVFTGESSFSNENNLLQLFDALEIEDKQQCAILEARKILKTNPRQISKELINVTDNNNSSNSKSSSMIIVPERLQNNLFNFNRQPSMIDIKNNVKNTILLNKLAAIYSILIDLNIVTNVLGELSYMINLCNANCRTTPTTSSTTSNTEKKERDVDDEEGGEVEDNYLDLQQTVHDLSFSQITQINSSHTRSKNFSDLLNVPDALYFISQVLSLQRHTIAQLDTASLNIILTSNCFHYYMTNDVKSYLTKILQYKLQLQTQKFSLGREISMDAHRSDIFLKQAFSNVHFQEDNNSREHFINQQEFTNFRSQRDLFYKCFNIWEANHLNPKWSFFREVTPILKDIFNLSENFINMMHLAKLFISQLLISAINVAPTPQEIGLADMTSVDQEKLHKLSQRLIAPSKFSRDYQFPRVESFFQQFIDEARSWAFLEQLKMELYAELLMRNNCALNHLNIYQQFSIISGNDMDVDIDSDLKSSSYCHNFHSDIYNCNDNCDYGDYYIVKHDDMQSLLLLAKFLGYVISLPYINLNIINKDGNNKSQNNGNCRCGGGSSSTQKIPIEIERNQIRLRNIMQYKFETTSILLDAMQNGKLLITLPWMVQYYAMLDNITLQLESNLKTLQLMFGLYMAMGLNYHEDQQNSPYHDLDVKEEGGEEVLVASKAKHTNALHYHHCNVTALFIIRICLGWLFDGQHILSDEYYSYRATVNNFNQSSDAKQLFNNEWKIINKALAFYKMPPPSQSAASKNLKLLSNFGSLLETMLTIICPFLAEFRASIIPAWTTLIKNISRSGKYRYITPRFTELSTASAPVNEQKSSSNKSLSATGSQVRLVQAFLYTLNSNTRLLINFCIERCYKSIVKDGHYKILLPSKRTADALVNKIDSIDYHVVYRECSEIYTKAKVDALKQWNSIIPQMLQRRIDNVLEGLLPEETCSSILKKTYMCIIQQGVEKKIIEWMHRVMYRTDFYCNALTNLANKISNANKIKQKQKQDQQHKFRIMPYSAELHITQLEPSLSSLLEDLQYWLHCTSIRQERLDNLDSVRVLLERLQETFENPLPPLFYHALVINIIQLMKHIVCSNKAQLTDDIIQAACHIWLHPKVQNALLSNDDQMSIYDGLITIAFIKDVSITSGAYDQLEKLLIIMINKHVVRGIYISERFKNIFEHNWEPAIVQDLCKMLDNIAKVIDSGIQISSYAVNINHNNSIHGGLH